LLLNTTCLIKGEINNMWINKLTDEIVTENVEKLKKNNMEDLAGVLELLYEEIKRLNLMINNGKTPYSTSETVDQETRKQLS